MDNERAKFWWSNFLIKPVQFLLDLIVLVSAFILAYLLRFDFAIPDSHKYLALSQLSFVVLIQFAALTLAGVYTFIWRYVGIAEIRSFFHAWMGALLPLLLLRLALPSDYQLWRVPLSIIIIDGMLAFGGVLGVRIMRRAIYERYEKRRREATVDREKSKPVLLIGAGRAGIMAAREIQNRGDMNLAIKGFVDDDPRKRGAIIHGIKVLGATKDLSRLVRQLEIDHVVITIAQASRQDIRRIVDACEQIPIKVRIIPGLYEILQGQVQVSRIRDLQLEDLLGRDPVVLDTDNLTQFLTGKVVVITGAGGSIGSELARQVARFNPSKLLLLERAEPALFNIDCELRENTDLNIIPLIADVGDETRVRSIFEHYRPQVIFHAAAHKHVPMMELNVAEAIKNNVLATNLLGRLAGEVEAEVFVLISTDKAVRPSSVMGASKRVAELVVQNLNHCFKTRFVAVRFGNVIGSAGSVLPIFREQIRKGGPVTVTHPDMTRYFMTIPEAAQLVLQTGAMADGGEIFVLDMGEPVRILDLAKDTITLSGLKPFEDIDIVITGVRPGEKLFEELEMTDEEMSRTRHPKIFIGNIAAYSNERVALILERLASLSREGQEKGLRDFLEQVLPEACFNPSQFTAPEPALAESVAQQKATLAATP
ncbi:MAG TPA: nucleoside-diphosphate sugar epimerase/dehydratase [Pyrinomonadaceae bacterium]|nr:nucleoside-diphosphate sugar epimerase/dehydratase [Pyrinomonadaceae bacterium]